MAERHNERGEGMVQAESVGVLSLGRGVCGGAAGRGALKVVRLLA